MLMIVSARFRFSAYRFDGGTADCLLGFVVPRMRRGVGRFLLPRAGSSRTVGVSFAWALAIAFSLLANAHIISPAWRLVRPRRRRASAVDTFRVPVLSSSSSHHLVRRGRFRSHRPRVSPVPFMRASLSFSCPFSVHPRRLRSRNRGGRGVPCRLMPCVSCRHSAPRSVLRHAGRNVSSSEA